MSPTTRTREVITRKCGSSTEGPTCTPLVGQEGKGIDLPEAATHGAAEVGLEPAVIVVIAGDVLPRIAAGHEVVDRAVVLDA
jgi:hypothetical protein